MAEVIVPALVMRCKLCPVRLPPDSVLEAWQLHMQVEHDQDKVELELIAVCTCGAEMTFLHHVDAGDYHVCMSCGNSGTVQRRS